MYTYSTNRNWSSNLPIDIYQLMGMDFLPHAPPPCPIFKYSSLCLLLYVKFLCAFFSFVFSFIKILILPFQGAIKYGRLTEFLQGKPDFHRKFGLFWPILANNLKENSVRLTESINFSQEILICCFALPGSRKNYSALRLRLTYQTLRKIRSLSTWYLEYIRIYWNIRLSWFFKLLSLTYYHRYTVLTLFFDRSALKDSTKLGSWVM